MRKYQTFIICHSKEFIIEHAKEFEYWENVTWLFVGDSSVYGLKKWANENKINIVVCRNLPDNIEHQPELLHLTAMYAIAHNQLIDEDTTHIQLFEYDLIWGVGAKQVRDSIINRYNSPIICSKEMQFKHHFANPAELNSLNDKALMAKYGFNSEHVLRKYRTKNKWMISINFIMTREYFVDLFSFVMDVCYEFYRGEKQAGNNLERIFTTFTFLKGYKWQLLNQISNSFNNSHNTSMSVQKDILNRERNRV